MPPMVPMGLVEGEYKPLTSTLSAYPMYVTPNLELTQYTPNRITGYMSNYNEDMRKIDRNSVSVSAYIQKNLTESKETHDLLKRMIVETNSILAYEQRRITANSSSIAALKVELAQLDADVDSRISQAKQDIHQDMLDDYNNLSEQINIVDGNLTSYIITNSATVAMANQRLHTLEDEFLHMKNNQDASALEVTQLKTDVSGLKLWKPNVDKSLDDINTVLLNHKNAIDNNRTDIAGLKQTDQGFQDQLTTLNSQVDSNTENIKNYYDNNVMENGQTNTEDIKTLKETVQTISNTITSQGTRIASNAERIQTTSSTVNQLVKDATWLQQENQNRKDEIAALSGGGNTNILFNATAATISDDANNTPGYINVKAKVTNPKGTNYFTVTGTVYNVGAGLSQTNSVTMIIRLDIRELNLPDNAVINMYLLYGVNFNSTTTLDDITIKELNVLFTGLKNSQKVFITAKGIKRVGPPNNTVVNFSTGLTIVNDNIFITKI